MNKNNGRFGIIAAVVTASFATFAPAANAQFTTVINGAGQTQLNDNTFPTGAVDPTPGATDVFVAELFSNFDSGLVNNERVTGTLASRVFRNTNGFLDFFYQVNITSSTAGVTATNLSDFSLFNTSAAFDNDTDIDGAGVSPVNPFTTGGLRPFGAQRANGGIVAFAFNANPRTQGNDQSPIGDGTLQTGNSSAVLGVRTDATDFRVSNGTVNAGAAANAGILAPTAGVVVPEAGTFALLLPGVALGALAIVRRKK